MSVTKHGVELAVRAAGAAAVHPVNINWEVGKFKDQLPCIQEETGTLERHLRKIDYVQQHYPRLGILRDDQRYEKQHLIQEARRRMDEQSQQSRIFRLFRANFLQGRKDLLPEDQWTPMDAEHCYLNDIIHGIETEWYEKNLVKCATNDFDGLVDRVMMSYFRIRYFFEIKAMKSTLESNLVQRKLI